MTIVSRKVSDQLHVEAHLIGGQIDVLRVISTGGFGPTITILRKSDLVGLEAFLREVDATLTR